GCANKVRKLLMIGTPNHGAVVAGAFAAYDSMPINDKYYNCNSFNPIGYLHYGARYLCLANCPDTDTLYSRNPRGDKTGAIILEFFGASLGQAGLGLAIPYVVARATSPDHNMESWLESLLTFLILYSVGAPIGSTTGCLITGRLLGEPSKSFGYVFMGSVIGEAIGWGAQLLIAHIGKESFIFFFIPVSIGAVVAYNKNNVPGSSLENYNNINKHIGYNESQNDYYPQKINMKLFNVNF
ncbi:MAG: hypothetical protein ACUVTX_10590, partial [Bacteroidales bacterium]